MKSPSRQPNSAPGWRAFFGCALVLLVLSDKTPTWAETTNRSVPALALKDAQGMRHQPLVPHGEKATVFFFVLHDCPLARRSAPEINRIVADYATRGVRSFLVYVESDLSAREARRCAREFGHTCPVLLDRESELARFAGVTISPEAAVLSPDNTVLYRGRIDDRLPVLGKPKVVPAQHDLRDALDAVLAGKPVPNPVTKAVGCYLPLKETAKPAVRKR